MVCIKIQLHDVPENKRYWMTIKTESLREMLEIINRVDSDYIHY